jgi:hypothetical protein
MCSSASGDEITDLSELEKNGASFGTVFLCHFERETFGE